MASSQSYHQVRRSNLSATARETLDTLPKVLGGLQNFSAVESRTFALAELPHLEPAESPGYRTPVDPNQALPAAGEPIDIASSLLGTRVRVHDHDTLDAAITLSRIPVRDPQHTHTSHPPHPRVAVLNLASDKTPGGGWLNGALAQEESICYRSSLYLSLHWQYYPIPALSGIYSPSVVVIRESWSDGHKLISGVEPKELPIVSVISVAALRKPPMRILNEVIDGVLQETKMFANANDRNLTKGKMRLSLRIAAHYGHRRLILGALGCGAFGNPNNEVALCWKEVLREPEFRGGWWEEVVFAVLDKGSDGDNGARDQKGNFATFHRQLHGLVV
jgi:uncharacterized protein (TIGR02452 family)